MVTTAVVNATLSGNLYSKFSKSVQVSLCRNYIKWFLGSGTRALFWEENFASRALSIKKYVDEDKDLQLGVLYALQIAVAKLQHPPGELDTGVTTVISVFV